MKHLCTILATALAAAFSGAAKTFDIDISTGRPAAANDAYYHGETIEFRAVRGRTAVTNIEYRSVLYTTNSPAEINAGTALWWRTDGMVFHPTNDVGAASYRFFMEGRDDIGRDWHANGTLRMLDSPGFSPSEVQLPVQTIDFAHVTALNAPWLDPSATNSLDVVLRGEIIAATNDIVTTESDPVAMPAVQAVSNDVAVLIATLNGETARFVVTNYNNVAEKAAAEVETKINGEWQTVWRELTRWDWLIGEYLPTNYYTKAECDANFADRAWGAFDPTTGNLTPDGRLWLSAPSIYICAGASYERVANAAGEYWVLTSNGMVADINGVSSNGFFRIADSDGVTQFEIVKGDRQTLAAVAGAMRSETVMGVLHYFTTYYVTGAAETPKATFARSLDATPSTPITWYEETDDACPFNVSWTNPESGTYVCEWWPKATEPKGFMKAEYVRGGETYIKNTAPVSVAGGILCTDGIHKVRPVYSNGSVTWEVVNP